MYKLSSTTSTIICLCQLNTGFMLFSCLLFWLYSTLVPSSLMLMKTIVYIIFAFLITTNNFALTETIQNPILADNFGFSIKNVSYAILVSSCSHGVANVFMYVSYYYIRILTLIVFRYFLQRIRVDNRLICIVGLVIQIIGLIVSSDWQSIRGDPCISVGQLDTTLTFDSVTIIANDTTYVTIEEGVTGSLLSVRENLAVYDTGTVPFVVGSRTIVCSPVEAANVSLFMDCYWPSQEVSMLLVLQENSIITSEIDTDCFNIDDCMLTLNMSHHEPIDTFELFCSKDFSFEENGSNCSEQDALLNGIDLSLCYDTSSLDSQCVCESFNSMPDYQCFWNPNSRITNDYCEQCPRVCLSTNHSLNFAQIAIGLLLIGFGYILSRFTYTLIVSDCFGDKSQVRTILNASVKPLIVKSLSFRG